jgi:hypothetical protein
LLTAGWENGEQLGGASRRARLHQGVEDLQLAQPHSRSLPEGNRGSPDAWFAIAFVSRRIGQPRPEWHAAPGLNRLSDLEA